jgi:transketolase
MVIHMSTLKPFDKLSVLSLLKRLPRVVVAENHVVTGGLASAVADTVAGSGTAVKLRRIGIPDCFCDSGSIPYLVKRDRMDPESIVAAALQLTEAGNAE